MPAKPLTDEQIQDATRLKSLFLRRKETDPSLTQEKLAFMCGWKTQGTITQYMNGKIPLNLTAVQKFAEALGARLEDISPSLAQRVDSLQKSTGGYAALANGADMPDSPDNVEIRLYSPSELGTAAKDAERDSDFSIRKMTVSKSFLQNNVKFSALKDLALTPAVGNSMDGTYSDGDLLLIDRGVTRIKESGGIYGFQMTDEVFTRRIERRPNGDIAIISDNKQYEPYIVPRSSLDNIRIHYRVVFAWTGKKFT
ncbi:helix-turn-helix transcriptional regulator [Collimonas sp. NPDC087041]|uniref:LexA family transcriptional regulator n=1 Tax=Collimonas sp. NPDC087041 TaxID=3363960 RepID=UPI0037F11516